MRGAAAVCSEADIPLEMNYYQFELQHNTKGQP